MNQSLLPVELGDADETAVAERPAESGNLLPVIQRAIENGIDPAKLEKMLDLHDRWTQARAKERFAEALAAFQRDMPQVKKRRTTKGGKFNFQYASLDDVMKAAQPLLAAHGISIRFDSERTGADAVAVINVSLTITVGSHSEVSRFGCPIPRDLNASEPQKWGAALSYAKRYALCAALNIVVTDEDDDAAGVVDTITATQMIELESLIQQTGTNLTRFLEWAECESLDRMARSRFDKALAFLKQKGVKR